MNTWQALKKIVRDQFTRPAPEPWNGKHELKYCLFVQVESYMDYYHGWEWKCTCGAGNYQLPTLLVGSEVAALKDFRYHQGLHESLTPTYLRQESCLTRLMDGRNEIRCWLTAGHEGDCK